MTTAAPWRGVRNWKRRASSHARHQGPAEQSRSLEKYTSSLEWHSTRRKSLSDHDRTKVVLRMASSPFSNTRPPYAAICSSSRSKAGGEAGPTQTSLRSASRRCRSAPTSRTSTGSRGRTGGQATARPYRLQRPARTRSGKHSCHGRRDRLGCRPVRRRFSRSPVAT